MDCFRPKDRLNEIYERELNELKKLTVHRELAIAAGIDYCAEQNICAPPWLVKEASLLICDLLKREKVQKRGRSGGLIARYRQDMWDVERWDAVEAVRRMKRKVGTEMEIMRSYNDEFKGSKALNSLERALAWFRHGTFTCASMLLSGREARAGADTMKASFRRCNRRAGDGKTPDRYYVFDERFLRKLGFPSLSDRKRGTKVLPFYNLTP